MAVPLVAAGGAGAAGAGAAGAAGMGGLGVAAAALGPVGWGLLAVSAISSVMSSRAASAQAKYQQFQLRLAEQQGQLDARNTMIDLTRDFRYNRGVAMASLGYGAAGVGESFLAVRNDEYNLYNRDVRNARLSALAGTSQRSAAAATSRARAKNEQMLGYLSLVQTGLRGYQTHKRLQGPGDE